MFVLPDQILLVVILNEANKNRKNGKIILMPYCNRQKHGAIWKTFMLRVKNNKREKTIEKKMVRGRFKNWCQCQSLLYRVSIHLLGKLCLHSYMNKIWYW